MRLLCILIILIPSITYASDDTQWHWRYGHSTGEGWQESKGMGKVDINANKISGSLFDHKDTTFKRFKLKGSLKENRAEVTVTVMHSDVDARKMVGKLSTFNYHGQVRRTLILTDDWSYLALTRLIMDEKSTQIRDAVKQCPSTLSFAECLVFISNRLSR